MNNNQNQNQPHLRNKKITRFIVFIMQIIGKKLMQYFYCTEDPDNFNKTKQLAIGSFSPEYFERYRYTVGDLIYLSDGFAKIELELLISQNYFPSRENLKAEIKLKSRCSFYVTLLRLILETIIILIILIDKTVSDEFYCLDKLYEDTNFFNNNNNSNSTIINDNITSNEANITIYNKITLINNSFWYCNLGKCIVIKKKWRLSKMIRIVHIIFFYGIILGYEYYLFFTLKRIIIKSIYKLFFYNILGYICLIWIFCLNFNDDKICSASKINNNQFVKEMKKEYDLFILLVNIIYSLL